MGRKGVCKGREKGREKGKKEAGTTVRGKEARRE